MLIPYKIRVTVLTCALLVAQSALAFYNPSTGRWLSRDPIEEEDEPALSVYVHNNPANDWDFLGLCGDSPGVCGPNVTAPVVATIGNIRHTFSLWNRSEKWRGCINLYGLYARGAWGMNKITQFGFGTFLFYPPAVPGAPGSCRTTVAYKQNCYQSSDVNYLMWGAINKLCWRSVGLRITAVWSLGWAQSAAMAWKGGHGDPLRRWVGAVAFTRAGWQEGNLNLTWSERLLVREKGCTVLARNRAVEPAFDWQRYPNAILWPVRPWPLPGGP